MSGKDEVATWLNDNLSSLLSFPVPGDLIEYIMSIENERDIEDYLKTLLDFDIQSHKQFCDNYKIIRHFKVKSPNGKPAFCDTPKKPEKGKSQKPIDKDIAPLLDKLSLNDDSPNKESSGKKGKKNKYINLYSPEGIGRDVVQLKGRHKCECQAAKHRLVNNCLNCGRIVCAQEGSGPCFFCGSLVCSKEEQEFLNTKSAQSQKLFDNLMEAGRPAGWEEAVRHRDRLLEYDRTTQRRTKVIDDESEYYSASSVWLSSNERKKLEQREEEQRKKKHASRSQVKFTLDFAGRKIVEDLVELDEPLEDEEWMDAKEMTSTVVNPSIKEKWQPAFVQPRETSHKANDNNAENKFQKKTRVQDRQLMEMSDLGLCISLHQPWASLLAHGIMRHEGRSWYSPHRGRLWIAAASKPPTESEIKETEEFFRLLRGGEAEFPRNYPTSCLLGCVNVTDVLSQEEYQSRYKSPESQSPFVFICEDATPLSLKFPIVGQHKIYKLDSKIHLAAQKALIRNQRCDA